MLDYLLTFLGINSWYVNFYPVKKYKIESNFKIHKELKSINKFKLIDIDTPSPRFVNMTIKKEENKYKYIAYTIYSFIIFNIVSIQSYYTLYKFIVTFDILFLCSFLLHINIPLIYIWGKRYYRSNHFDMLNVCKKFKVSLIIISTLISFIINFLDISSFYNEYYWLNIFDNNILFFTIIVIEWVYSRLLIFLFMYTFILILNKHCKTLKGIKTKLDMNEYNLEDNICLSNIINDISNIRFKISLTINFFNDTISMITLIGGISLAIFIKNVFPNGIYTIDPVLTPQERYLLHPLVLYIISNVAIIYMMYNYANTREEVLKYIKSYNFTSRFLTRTPVHKILKQSNNNVDLLTLNVMEETATTIDWIVLGNLLSEKWLDFNIFGITTSDGSLIKKSIAFGSTVLFVLNFLQNNN